MTSPYFRNIVVGTLGSGQLQIWANTGAPGDPWNCQTRWKTTADPNAGWTPWNSQPNDGQWYLATTSLATSQLQLFGIVAFLESDGTLSQTVSWKAKESPTPANADAPWGSWQNFPQQLTSQMTGFAGAVLGAQQGPYWQDTPTGLWALAGNTDTGPTYSQAVLWQYLFMPGDAVPPYPTPDSWQLFAPAVPGVPPAFLRDVWPLYANGNVFALWVNVWESANIYWSQANIQYENNNNISDGPNWSAWGVFPPLPAAANGKSQVIGEMAASQLANGAIQIFAASTTALIGPPDSGDPASGGTLYTIWQDAEGKWPSAWQTFPLPPGGNKILLSGLGLYGLANEWYLDFMSTLALAPLPDGRLELFAIDDQGELWTTWQISTDPSAAWANWVSLS
jgi:hypothetical protein